MAPTSPHTLARQQAPVRDTESAVVAALGKQPEAAHASSDFLADQEPSEPKAWPRRLAGAIAAALAILVLFALSIFAKHPS